MGEHRAVRLLVGFARRLLIVVAVGLLVSFTTFFALRMARDPVLIVGASRSDVDIRQPGAQRALAHELGTDRSLIAQYGDWLGKAVQGDFGTSYVHPTQRVSTKIAKGLPINIELVVLAQLIALAVALPLGLWAGSRAGRWPDRLVSGVATALMSIPAFALAIVLILVLSVQFDLFPTNAASYVSIFDDPVHNLDLMFLPALSLAVGLIGVYTRVLRSDVATTLQEDFVLMARARGLPPRSILLRHALRPSSLSLLSLVGLQSGLLLGGSILVEILFAFPYGIGTSLVSAAVQGDIPIVLACSTVIAVLFTAITLTIDAILRAVDPRISRG